MPQVFRHLFPLADENVISSRPSVTFGNCLPCWILMILSWTSRVSHHRCADEHLARNLKDTPDILQSLSLCSSLFPQPATWPHWTSVSVSVTPQYPWTSVWVLPLCTVTWNYLQPVCEGNHRPNLACSPSLTDHCHIECITQRLKKCC